MVALIPFLVAPDRDVESVIDQLSLRVDTGWEVDKYVRDIPHAG